ncbi:MAG TPA: chemotaxis protein CheB [Pyrinomonadaceae bacterium]|jgi:two-component system chemotaxis response regulator CheB
MSGERVVVVGTSAGGLAAMQVLLPGLADDFPWPVVLVQHRSKEPGSELCKYLGRCCRRNVSEPEDKEPIMAGRVYLAPRDYHLLVERGNFALSTEAPVYFARPSIDVLFESAADAYGAGVVGVVLTGANGDGARGLARIKAAGGVAVVQDPSTARAPEMPRAAIKAANVDRVLPLPEIAPFLNGLGREAAR